MGVVWQNAVNGVAVAGKSQFVVDYYSVFSVYAIVHYHNAHFLLLLFGAFTATTRQTGGDSAAIHFTTITTQELFLCAFGGLGSGFTISYSNRRGRSSKHICFIIEWLPDMR